MSAARPFPAPPVSSRVPGGRRIERSVTVTRAQLALRSGRRGPARRSLLRALLRARARARGASGRTRRLRARAVSVGSTSPSVSSAAISPAAIAPLSNARRRHLVARIGVQPRELALRPEAAQIRLEVLEELPARGRRGLVGDDQPDVGAHAVEGEIGHDERVVSGAGAGAAGAGAGAAGAGAAGAALGRRALRRRRVGRARRLRPPGGPVLDDPGDDHPPDDDLARPRLDA